MKTSVLKAGAAVAGLALVVAGGVTVLDDDDSSADTLTTTVADAGQLEVGNEVRAAGALVGSIQSIDLVDNKAAKVVLKLDPGVLPVHRDATLTVRPVNLLGEDYVDLDPGSDDQPYLDPPVLPAGQTSTAVTLSDVLDTFQAPTAANLAALVTALGEGLHGNGAETKRAIAALAPAMRNTQALGELLGQQNEVLAHLVSSVDPVAAALADDDGRTLDSLVASTKATLSAIASQQEALSQTIQQLPATLVSAQRTLAQFGGVAREATPALRSLRPLTGDLSDVVAEIEDFADAADPALASLEPVLRRADDLLDQAAPVVAQLNAAGPDLADTAAGVRPVSRELLDKNLYGVMEFVRKWALSTNGRDALSHYFRGVVYLTPQSLQSIVTSLIPAQVDLDPTDGLGGGSPHPTIDLPSPLPDIDLPNLPGAVGGLLGGLGGLFGRSSAADGTTRTADDAARKREQRRIGDSLDATSALGLTSTQESALVGQLLGGTQ